MIEQVMVITRILQQYTIEFPKDFKEESVGENAYAGIIKPSGLEIVLKKRELRDDATIKLFKRE